MLTETRKIKMSAAMLEHNISLMLKERERLIQEFERLKKENEELRKQLDKEVSK